MVLLLKLRRISPTSIEVLPVNILMTLQSLLHKHSFTLLLLETQLIQVGSNCYVGQKAVNKRGT